MQTSQPTVTNQHQNSPASVCTAGGGGNQEERETDRQRRRRRGRRSKEAIKQGGKVEDFGGGWSLAVERPWVVDSIDDDDACEWWICDGVVLVEYLEKEQEERWKRCRDEWKEEGWA